MPNYSRNNEGHRKNWHWCKWERKKHVTIVDICDNTITERHGGSIYLVQYNLLKFNRFNLCYAWVEESWSIVNMTEGKKPKQAPRMITLCVSTEFRWRRALSYNAPLSAATGRVTLVYPYGIFAAVYSYLLSRCPKTIHVRSLSPTVNAAQTQAHLLTMVRCVYHDGVSLLVLVIWSNNQYIVQCLAVCAMGIFVTLSSYNALLDDVRFCNW